MDKVDSATRSRIMSRIRGKDTQPELMLRRGLTAQGLRYRIHQRGIVGTPDLSHKGKRWAVFVDGCFWHGCPKHYRAPTSRQDYWSAKLARNRRRRDQVLCQLADEGWHALQVWECDVRSDPEATARSVARALSRRLDKS